VRVTGALNAVLRNREGDEAFNTQRGWSMGPPEPGLTAVVRAKDEARTLPWTLPPLLRAVQSVLLVDNASTDGTPKVARQLAQEAGAEERLQIRSYPFRVSRCGPEHLATHADSLHSLTYFYNWSFSHVRTAYTLKWDADMVLSEMLVRTLRDLSWQLEASEVVVQIPRHPLYVADERHAFIDTEIVNAEPWAWPNRPGYAFAKAFDWELTVFAPEARWLMLPRWTCIELKHLDVDEFAHSDFQWSARTRRKLRERTVFETLAAGRQAPDGVVRIDAPAGQHVIDYVRTTWLPAKACEGRRSGSSFERFKPASAFGGEPLEGIPDAPAKAS
jgi:hypothetical protein